MVSIEALKLAYGAELRRRLDAGIIQWQDNSDAAVMRFVETMFHEAAKSKHRDFFRDSESLKLVCKGFGIKTAPEFRAFVQSNSLATA